jgi:predicted aldo/keto reductase-like oxidoreductase
MSYRPLGQTGIMVSAVGFGTSQLRVVPEQDALDTLIRGFELGVNLVHVAPDYEGAERLLARAIRESAFGSQILICTQGYDVHGNSGGPVQHFERLFEQSCQTFDRECIDLYGIACIDDRENFGENVWGTGGMVEFLARKKQEGRIRATFCTTHGGPDFIRKLLLADVFDALMLAYNPLGFHLLSVHPPPPRQPENLALTGKEIFPLAHERGVGLMIMKPLAGGLLTGGGAFPIRNLLPAGGDSPDAGDVLRSILRHKEVSCVVPGTASVREAAQNALAGHMPQQFQNSLEKVERRVFALQSALCSRCGACEELCSQSLPVSWLFRAAYVSMHPGAAYENWDEAEYFALHSKESSTCSRCNEVTCECPYGLDIPASLMRLHGKMVGLKEAGLARDMSAAAPNPHVNAAGARVLTADLPREMVVGQPGVGRLWVENAGRDSWMRIGRGAYLEAIVDGKRIKARARHDTHPGGRAHFVFSIPPFLHAGEAQLFIQVKLEPNWRALRPTKVLLTMDHFVQVQRP